MTTPARAPHRRRRDLRRAGLACTVALTCVLLPACSGSDSADGPGTDAPGSSAGAQAGAPAGEAPDDGRDAGAAADADSVPDILSDAPDPDAETVTSDEIPEEFPDEVPLPGEYTVNVVTESVASGSTSYVVQLETGGDPREVFEALTGRFDEAEWRELQKSSVSLGGTPTNSAIYSNGTTVVNMGTIEGDGAGTVTISYAVLPSGD